MLPVPFMSLLPPLHLPRLSSVKIFQRRLLSLPGHRKGGNGLLMPQPNVHLLTSNCQQLPLLYQVRGLHPR